MAIDQGNFHTIVDTEQWPQIYQYMGTDSFVKNCLISLRQYTFLDYKYVSHNTCIVIHDGLLVPCTQLPQISSRVYSYSKYMLWTTFFWIMTRMSRISNSFGRLGNSQCTKYKDIKFILFKKVNLNIFVLFQHSATRIQYWSVFNLTVPNYKNLKLICYYNKTCKFHMKTPLWQKHWQILLFLWLGICWIGLRSLILTLSYSKPFLKTTLVLKLC